MTDNGTVKGLKAIIDDIIYSSVQVEGIGATFAQTSEIVRDGTARGVSSDDIQKILGIKHGLEYLFSHFQERVSWELYSTYNAIIGEGNVPMAGRMRGAGEVHVGDFTPEDVSVDRFARIVDTAMSTGSDPVEAACIMQLNLAKAQFFHDGNKRSSLMLANHLLAHLDAGRALVIRECDRDTYLSLLVSYYQDELSIADAAWDLEELACVKPDSAFHSAGGGRLLHDDRDGDFIEVALRNRVPDR